MQKVESARVNYCVQRNRKCSVLKIVRRPFLLFVAIVLLAQVGHATIYYVSKSGSDSNTGITTNLSFLTIQKAASVMNAGDTCYIFSGIYRETVTPAHSGTSGSPITFAAYPGATPIVSGADVLSLSWSVYSNSIYQASTTTSFRQLFVDGVMMNEARWPNATVNNLLYAPRSTPSVCTFTYLTDPSLPNVNLVGATLHIFPDEYNNPGYAANTRQITGWNSSTKTISWSGNIFNTNAQNTFYYVYGSLSLLDIPTEWYLDATGETLYLWAPDGASPATHVVEVKTRTSAFTLDNLSYITVNGIYVFAAGISMADTTDCIVDNCNLEYVQHNTTADWQVSVPIANQVSGNGSMWENSSITYSSQDGIRCTGQNEIVSNCVIQQVDYYPGTYYACVTAFSGGSGTKIVNNTLWYSGRYCVGDSATSVEIGYNDLGWGELLTSDGGGTSAVATLSVFNPSPSFTTQPVNQTNVVGQTATFTADAVGLSPLYYQWQAGAVGSGVYTNLIAGGQFSAVTNSILNINNLTLSNAGAFVVVVTNSAGSITSAVVTLTVITNSAYQIMITADHPVAYWPMQETAGPTIHDIVGGYNGTLMTSTDGTSLGANQHTAFTTAGSGPSDGATYLLGGPGGLVSVPGDTAIYFTNLNTSVNNSQIVVPYNTAFDPGTNFSAEAWIYVPGYPIGYTDTAFQTPLGFEAHGGSANGWWMGVETDSSGSEGDVQFNIAYYPGLSSPPASSSSFSGRWVYVAEIYTGSNSNLLCYTNGVLMTTADLSAYYESEGIYGIHKLPFVIGSYCASYNGGGTLATGYERGNFWHGGISHVAIYNYALTPSQISNHYQVGSTSATSPTMAIQSSGSSVTISWTLGFLQQAAALAGPWAYVTNAVSPYTIGSTNQAQFFRSTLQSP